MTTASLDSRFPSIRDAHRRGDLELRGIFASRPDLAIRVVNRLAVRMENRITARRLGLDDHLTPDERCETMVRPRPAMMCE